MDNARMVVINRKKIAKKIISWKMFVDPSWIEEHEDDDQVDDVDMKCAD